MKKAKILFGTLILGSLLVFSFTNAPAGKAEFGTSGPIKIAENAVFI
ncbi:hypothetical protein ACSYGW_13150 [Bacillus glycinifermentans]|nr:hypothetical protein [Bacillus glycinifermentans]MEC0495972.1 hypothetical protein [Bacillus glycinifermentans]MEC0539091.1 hypothetical protein [Bacillus glycinifermentans]